MHDPSHVLTPQMIRLDENLCYEEEPIAIVDQQIKKLCSKELASIKVIWKNHTTEEATWEVEEAMRAKYPQLFETQGKVNFLKFRDRIS